MSKTIEVGLIGFTDKGAWVDGYSSAVDGTTYTGYDENDIVHTGNGVYKSNQDGNTANPDTDTSGAWSVWVDNTTTAIKTAVAEVEEAVEKANAATTTANTAATNADNAVAKANTATTAANNAATNANNAVTKANTAATNANNAATKATTVAGNVNATLSDDNVFTVTDASGNKKTLDLAAQADIADVVGDVERASLALGHYSDRDDIVLTATETNKAISSDGVKVAKSGWAIAEFTAEKGNEYLFKPGVTDGSVCLFAEYIDKVEDRAIDYTYTYNTDGTIATATATYGGKTYNYTYTWGTDAQGYSVATIKDASGSVVSSLPLLYTTTVGTYSPLVKLNADAELPTDGYCRFMSHFQGNSALKVVVSYKVGSADLTMKVLRDGVFASISTQLGNLSQKQSQTESEVAELSKSYVKVMAKEATTVHVDGKDVAVPAKKLITVYPKIEFSIGYGWNEAKAKRFIHADVRHFDVSGVTKMDSMFTRCHNIRNIDVSGWDTSNVTTMGYMFWDCLILDTLDVSGWDTSNVTTMNYMFYGCNALTTLDVSGWDTSNVTNMQSMFCGCNALTTLDVSGWDTSNVTNMQSMFYNCKALTTLDVSGWDTSNVKGALGNGWAGLFAECTALTALDLSGWNTNGITSTAVMFNGCTALKRVDLSGWDTSNNTSMSIQFRACINLEWVDISNWDASKVTVFGWSNYWCFGSCDKLTTLIGDHTIEEVENGTVATLIGCKVNPHINGAVNLKRASLLAVIKGLADLTGSDTQTLTLHSTQKAKLTSEDIAIATGKNWTVA